MKKRAILLAVASIFVMGLFAACSNDDDSDTFVTNLSVENKYWYSVSGTYSGGTIRNSDVYVSWTSNQQSNYTDYDITGTFEYPSYTYSSSYTSSYQTVTIDFQIRSIGGKYLNKRGDYADVTEMFSGNIGGGTFKLSGYVDGTYVDLTFKMK